MTSQQAIAQVAKWAEKKAGGQRPLLEEVGRRGAGRGLNRVATVSAWKSGARYDADVLVAMVSFLTGRSVDDLVGLLGASSIFEVDDAKSEPRVTPQQIRRLPGGPDVKRK